MPVSKMGKSLRTSATSKVNVDIAPLHRHREGLRWDDRRKPGHLAGLQTESRPVLRALDLAALDQLAAAQEKVLVRAHIVDGIETVVAVGEADLLAVGEDSLDSFERDVIHRCHPMPSQYEPRARPQRLLWRAG